MSRRARTIHLVLFLAALWGLNYVVTGSPRFPQGDNAIWLHSGLLMLIIGMYWIEHFFTKPADVVITSLVVFVSVSTLNDPPLADWWAALRDGSIALAILAFLVIWVGSPAVPEHDNSRLKRILYLLLVRVGSAKVLFSAVFILALVSYFDLREEQVKVMVIFWGVLLVAKHLELEGLFAAIVSWGSDRRANAIGTLSRVSAPNILRFDLLNDATCKRGSLVAFTERGVVDESSPIALVIGYRATPESVEAEALVIDSSFDEGALDRRKVICKVSDEQDVVSERMKNNPLGDRLAQLIAFASRGSEIARVKFEMISRPQIEEGNLVAVPTPDAGDLLFQVVNGVLHEEASLGGGERSYTIGEAEQLGTWIHDRQGFETYSGVVPENSPVFLLSREQRADPVLKKDLVDVGRVPDSPFPVNINVRELVLFHSAILGVTGSGKSFLAYHVIEECAASGIKVICLDVTGDYKRYLRGPVLLKDQVAVRAFLGQDEKRIGIVEFVEEKIHPIRSANTISEIALEWCRDNRREEEVREPVPKVLLVLEEAHTLVPEWNSNPERGLQDVVNNTAKIVLQARKYGLGFMVVTQRTANVTKSILNQCNTIFAFQAYDETGFDFMKNYMGLHYVKALPNLKKRQGVLVGKASVSDRPVIVRFHDQDRDVTGEQIVEFQVADDSSPVE